jgi:hypothetical protein
MKYFIFVLLSFIENISKDIPGNAYIYPSIRSVLDDEIHSRDYSYVYMSQYFLFL